jgi:hypothetical protein
VWGDIPRLTPGQAGQRLVHSLKACRGKKTTLFGEETEYLRKMDTAALSWKE